MSNLRGHRAVIIGGSTGIGSGIVRALVARGARVHICDIDVAGAATLAAELSTDDVTVHPCDMTDPPSLAAAEGEIRAEGEISLLFVNAGAVSVLPLLDQTPADWEWLLKINAIGPFNSVKAFLPGLLSQDTPSRIIVTSSTSAIQIQPMGGTSLYAASKAATLGMCLGLMPELEGTKVALSVIFPGPVMTSIIEKSMASRPGSVQFGPTDAAATGAIDPPLAGERIVQAVELRETFISTHPGQGAPVRELQEAIMAAYFG